MPTKVVVLSGPVASGKSTLTQNLVDRFGFRCLKTRELIRALKPDVPPERQPLQEAGDLLDRETGGAWVSKAIEEVLAQEDRNVPIVIDSVRIKDQIDAIRTAYGPIVTHVHLTAPLSELSERYTNRNSPLGETPAYDAVRENPTEADVESLQKCADVVIDTRRSSREDVFERVASRLRLYGSGMARLVDVMIGGQFGSEGKGNIAAFLAPEYDILVRVGGPNAGHTVYAGAEKAVFRHLPSGSTRAIRATLVIGPGAAIWLPELQAEITRHEIEPERLKIDPRAILIEEVDRQREAELRKAIASTAQGVGQAAIRKISRTDADPVVRLASAEPALSPYLLPTCQLLEDAYAAGKKVFLEGTQGTLLSIHHGLYPHVTSRDTTASGTLAEAGIPPTRVRRVVMVCRTYPIRVGGPSGPMGTEISWDEVAKRSGIDVTQIKEAELTTTTKTQRRVSEFGWSDIRRAALLNGPTDIALTFADYLDGRNQDARRFEQLRPDTIEYVEELERVTGAPVSLIATRFHYRNIIDRRRW
jgi:adenylosuccinate synthase